MKYSLVTLLFLGVLSTAEARDTENSLVQLNSKEASFLAESGSDSESESEMV